MKITNRSFYRRFTAFLAAALTLSFTAVAVDLDYYLPNNVSYDQSITKPAEALGFEVGEWHVRPEQITRYMEILAEESDRITLEITGRSHEFRPMMVLKISAPENQNRLEEMRQQHLAVTDPSQNVNAKEAPLVIYMGYSVHGDESSGSNAAVLAAYYLAAAQGPEIDAWLDNTVILFDPMYNPDGLARFATWVNQYKSMTAGADSQHREHQQDWLRGRQNHYWFDLNRDWLLLQHPESQARIATYQAWMPNVLTDHHEMGTDATYFFQPGIPSRKNPLTPDENVRLTERLAEFHGAALDEIQSLYYTEESFDDFYYGKGSSYPDAQGTVAILFEQASSRGHLQESINGDVSFPFTIRNQFVTSLSTIKGAVAEREWLLDYQQRFFKENLELASKEGFDGYLLKETDEGRMHELLNILRAHSIDVYPVTESFSVNDETYNPGEAFYVPIRQRNYRLLKGAFTTRQDFPDNTFYDVSAWTLPMAFNVEFSEVRQNRRFRIAENVWDGASDFASNELAETNVGYIFSWEPHFAPRVLNHLLKEGIHARLAVDDVTVSTPNGGEQFSRGAVIVTRAYQDKPWQEVQAKLAELADANRVRVHTIMSGMTSTVGMDVGSRSINPATEPKVMLVIGDGVNLQEAGETWYYFDRDLNIPVTMIETQRLDRSDISRYTHIILVDGNHRSLSERFKNELQQWVRAGGTLIGQKGGARWMSENNLLATTVVPADEFREKFSTEGLTYADRNDYFGQQRIAGAIFNSQLDLSHPLTVGFTRETLPIFKNSTIAFTNSESPFVDVATYAEEPVFAGYTSQGNREVLSERTTVLAHRYGGGRVVGFADNVNFRGYFWGTSKLMANAIFFSQYALGTAGDEEEEENEDAHAH
ncbi:Zinc carboxypeptidase [Idiomarina sp. A28L]|uniref:M14 family zinc carboxypeptidase n=1 Tax=Idiomarina sp. A28L TaxID=1036674 RepID=UPI000213895D|nr:M14 family zinc carboxypeptidase [Idiomarina sp. A28L]EGN74491.1 Zinc carboxypeptidase [Idiomarina sp. A28L]